VVVFLGVFWAPRIAEFNQHSSKMVPWRLQNDALEAPQDSNMASGGPIGGQEGQGGPRWPKSAPKVAQVDLRRGSLGAKVAPRVPLEEPRGTQDAPMATQRGAPRAKMTQDGTKGGEKVGWARSYKALKIHRFLKANLRIWASHLGS
jgi:hypothetical protein